MLELCLLSHWIEFTSQFASCLPKLCVSKRLHLKKCNLRLHPVDKSFSHVSLQGSKQQNNTVFLSSSWKSSYTTFVLGKAALNDSRHAATLIPDTGLGSFPWLLRNIREQECVGGPHLSKVFPCIPAISPRPQYATLTKTLTHSTLLTQAPSSEEIHWSQ